LQHQLLDRHLQRSMLVEGVQQMRFGDDADRLAVDFDDQAGDTRLRHVACRLLQALGWRRRLDVATHDVGQGREMVRLHCI